MASLRSGSILGLLEKALPAHGERLRTLAARARSVGDDELVHDLRVALRRTEALARLFRGLPGKGDGEEPRASARSAPQTAFDSQVGGSRPGASRVPGGGDGHPPARARLPWRPAGRPRRGGRRRGGRAGPRSLEASAGRRPGRRLRPARSRRHGPPPANSPPAHPARPQARRIPPSGPENPSRRADRGQAGPLRPRGARAARAAFPSDPSSPALLPGRRGRRPRPRRARGTRRVRRGCGHRGRPRIRAAGARPRGRRHEGAPGRPGEGYGSRQADREAAQVPRVARDEVG